MPVKINQRHKQTKYHTHFYLYIFIKLINLNEEFRSLVKNKMHNILFTFFKKVKINTFIISFFREDMLSTNIQCNQYLLNRKAYRTLITLAL